MSSTPLEPGDLAYLAAIVDSQCRLTTRKIDSGELPQVDLNTPNRELLNVFAAMTGTAWQIRRRKYNKSGCTEHCPLPHQHVFSVSGHWSVVGMKATVLLFNVEPFCRIRQEQVQALIELGLQVPYKPATVRKMQELGYAIPMKMADSDEIAVYTDDS